jgi:hypothetical protein
MSRYVVERGRGFTRMLWLVRARLRDSATGEELDLRSEELAEEVRRALERAGAGDLDPLPADASPFRRYETMSAPDGWHYLTRSEGALDHEPFGRTRSKAFAERVVEALNRVNPRKLRNPYGPPKARWF